MPWACSQYRSWEALIIFICVRRDCVCLELICDQLMKVVLETKYCQKKVLSIVNKHLQNQVLLHWFQNIALQKLSLILPIVYYM